MLKRTIITAICIILMLSLPLISAGHGISLPEFGQSGQQPESKSSETEPEKHESEKAKDTDNDKYFIIKNDDSGKTEKVGDRQLCIGVLAVEMSPDFEHEALCAQTVALYSHYSFLRNKARSEGREYDIKDSEAPYLTEEELKKRWGKGFDDGFSKISGAVDEVFGIILTEGDEKAADAAYFAISSGRTEDAADVFGKSYPFLVPAASPWDKLQPGYLSTKTVSADELCEMLPDIRKQEDGSISIGTAQCTDSGTVMNINIGGADFTGAEIRSALDLRSACFELERDGEDYVFTVRGYGHGVGMSQCGANAMAEQGASWQEIISHYYPGSCIFDTGLKSE